MIYYLNPLTFQLHSGHVGWGIAWYINGLMIPEIHVVRGKTYTFVIEGGNDPGQTAAYHPFYITDDPEGGYEFKTKEQRRKVRVFAGIEESRGISTGLGYKVGPRLCDLAPRGQREPKGEIHAT